MRKALPILFLLSAGQAVAQSRADSLWAIHRDPAAPIEDRLRVLNDIISENYLFSKPDSAFLLAQRMHAMAKAHGNEQWMGAAAQNMGGSFYVRSMYDSALHYFERALPHFEAAGKKKGLASTLGNMANILTDQGDYEQGLVYYRRALKVHEELGNRRGQAIQLMNIGIMYKELGEPDTAFAYYQRALPLHAEVKDPDLFADLLVNIGDHWLERGDQDKAMDHYQRALASYIEAGSPQGKAHALTSIGRILVRHGRKGEAVERFARAMALQRELGDDLGLASTLIEKADALRALGDRAGAINDLERALSIAEGLHAVMPISEASRKLYELHRDAGDTRRALKHFERHIAVRDSVLREENQRALYRQEYQYEYDKRAFADSVAFASEKAIQQKEIERQKTVRNGFMGGFALVALFAVVFLFQRNRISKEKARSEELLLNILPEEVAEELKAKGEAEAKQIDQVTVLFTDFKGFTAMSEQVSAKQLVHDLHECFSAFDLICARHGIEKIKTIGDAYMAAGGVPVANSTHAMDVIRAALAMRDFIAEGKARKIAEGKPYFEIRIGVHTGPVVAGIVGVKKFQYDIWGDTVNTAARMESSGAVGRVNISAGTHALVKADPAFAFEARGQVAAKGKGELEMWFVERAVA
jgi:class 3 adenylate cyclase/Tfp pilus assembly protein PilF